MTDKPLLSVRLMTYNHAKFIEECLKGIQIQKTSFPFEVVIGDDFSTDNNLEIIKRFIAGAKNPKITYRLLDRKRGDAYDKERQKRGRAYNFINILDNCKGKYIALIDGDDYWTDPLKLQKQVEFLEANPEFVVCGHNAMVIDDQGKVLKKRKQTHLIADTDFSGLELQRGAYLNTLSLVFRNEIISFPAIFEKCMNLDSILLSLLGNKGCGKYIEDIAPGVYRVHGGGVWSLSDRMQRMKSRIITFEAFLKFYKSKPEVSQEYHKRLVKISRDLLASLPEQKSFKDFWGLNYQYLKYKANLFSLYRWRLLINQNFKFFKKRLVSI